MAKNVALTPTYVSHFNKCFIRRENNDNDIKELSYGASA